MNTIPKDQWIEEVYSLLCESQGNPENVEEAKMMREWAESLADGENYFSEGSTPKDAVREELSCA